MKGSSHATCCTKGKNADLLDGICIKKTQKQVSAPDEERMEEAD